MRLSLPTDLDLFEVKVQFNCLCIFKFKCDNLIIFVFLSPPPQTVRSIWKQEPCLVTFLSPESSLARGIYFLKDWTDR